MGRGVSALQAETATAVFAGLDPARYRPHALHGSDRIWPETNCSVDLWIEVIAALGLEPAAAMGFTVTMDFEGDQFSFFKIPPEDMESLYGLRLGELAIFDAPERHAAEQVGRGRLVLMEVDGFHLPDTRGVSYRTEHGKTTVGINRIDLDAGRMEYFHNGGYHALAGEDFAGVFQLESRTAERPFLPYTEFVKIGRAPGGDVRAKAEALFARHWARRPADNPVRAFQGRFAAQAVALYERPAFFHKYAFNTLRQLGANFELMAAGLDFLGATDAAVPALAIAEGAKTVQFQLARAVARQRAEALPAMLAGAADAWDLTMERLNRRFG